MGHLSAPAVRPRPRLVDQVPVVAAIALLVTGAVVSIWIRMGTNGHSLIDLSVYRAASRAVLHGASLYGPSLRNQLGVPLPYTYPPAAAVLTTFLAPLPNLLGDWLWELGGVAVLVACVGVAFAPMASRLGRWRWLGLAAITVASLWLTPVRDHLGFGQIDLLLLGLCLADCTARQPRWPRGCLIGLATAVKLVPGVFIVYLLLTRRTRAAGVAVATMVGLSGVAWLVGPGDSSSFWLRRIFETQQAGNNAYFSNQSIKGMLTRMGNRDVLLWLVLVAGVALIGLLRARRASLGGHELAGVVLVGLVGVLASPVSWIHSAVWVVPALGVLVGRGTDKRRMAAAVALAVLFMAGLPYLGADLHRTGGAWEWGTQLLKDSYGLACLGLVMFLPLGERDEPAELAGRPEQPPVPALAGGQGARQ
ncbi:MAG: hypothetical protein DLM54_03250 [Acidimicrobiales bacterium]|nr:MAG: hypothetical protein DLM54_03250 [Acidimicrobiales bacterium]